MSWQDGGSLEVSADYKPKGGEGIVIGNDEGDEENFDGIILGRPKFLRGKSIIQKRKSQARR